MNGSALHCQRIGAGPDLVLLHGWGLHAGIWAPLTELLATRFRLHLFDLPGHGHSAPVENFTLDEVCDALAQAAPAPAHWLGWSLGGQIALAFAARFPHRVERLLMVASNPRFVATDTDHPGMAPEVLANFARDLETDHSATITRFLSLVARGAPDASVLRLLRRALAAAPAPTPGALRSGLAILRDTDLRAELPRLAMPVAWLAGARDTLVPFAAMQNMVRAYPAMQLHVFEQAGHAPFVSHPQPVASAVTEFLQ
jgi:pimeloyl-[acyl-carrier protein] methyl ester esterase